MKIDQELLLAALGTMLLLLIAGCGQKGPQQLEKIIIGPVASVNASPIWIAENKGYFREEGLKVEINESPSGPAALKTLLEDKGIDLATAAQTPIVINSFHRNDYAIIGVMGNSDNDHHILARRDRGIKAPNDLKGKIVGTRVGSSGHFFLGLFLTYHQMRMSDVKIVDLELIQLPAALLQGQVDAIAGFEPYIYQAGKALGDKALLFPSQGLFRDDVYFIARKDYLKDHIETLKRFLRAIEKADAYISKNDKEAMEIIGQTLKMDIEGMKPIWKDLIFKLILDQSILISLENQARWAIRNKLTDAVRVPNYLDYIYSDILKAVNPEAVTIAGR
jgi:ABC-type nitrate/sulfonate/bicarbonate transport system substrate-binding protein